MKYLLLSLFMAISILGVAQLPPYRYTTVSNANGSTFYALDGSSGKLRYMNDYGDAAGEWKAYGSSIRETGSNNLMFDALSFDNGVVFYVIEANTGELWYMADFGDNAGKWKRYGDAVRATGSSSLTLEAERLTDGAKFTALDCNTGQLYYMLDFGDDAGRWKWYGSPIK